VDVDTFLSLAEFLTGTPVKDVTDTDCACLTGILQDDARAIDCSQFNELLLLVNKDRVSECFFEYFFGEDCQVSTLPSGVEKFQKSAMLCYGNFIHAFRTLARIEHRHDLHCELGEFCRAPGEAINRFQNRSEKLLDIDAIPKIDTPLVGYLSASEILAELERARYLRQQLAAMEELAGANWDPFQEQVLANAGIPERSSLQGLLSRYRARFPDHGVMAFAEDLNGAIEHLEQRDARVQQVRDSATRNQDIYLTWDHMDVYFATSMRKRWEYEDLFDFVHAVMNDEELTPLRLRYFDPTQAFTQNRVNKGLVESLMLKRARCTVYSVQDTDTLGKDSELAATLAQGKTVIAYVPTINVAQRRQQLVQEDPGTIQERLRFVLYADDAFASSIPPEDLTFVREFRELETFEGRRVWRSVPDEAEVGQLRAEYGGEIERLCGIIANSEARIYDRRARTLRNAHPLAIQVNLVTGVANGVLVVRNVPDCAALLRRVLTNSMDFQLVNQVNDRMWYLNEQISGCPFRVVTKDRKLTNCFWNFYRKPVN